MPHGDAADVPPPAAPLAMLDLQALPRTGFEVTSLQGYQQDAESLDLSIIDAEYLIAV